MKPNRLPPHRRLAFQLGLASALVTCASFAALGWFLSEHERETLTAQLTLRVLSETRNLSLAAAAPLLRDDPELGLHPLIVRALDEIPDLQDLVVLDADEIIVGHRDLLRVGDTLEITPESTVDVASIQPRERVWIGQGDLWVMRPVQHLGQEVGALVARVDRSGIDELVRESVTKTLSIAGAGLLVLVVLIVVLVSRSLRPLGPLREVVQRIESGDLSARADVHVHNELGLLARRINEMAGGLQRAQGELIEKMRMDHELAIARDLQSRLLPSGFETPRGFALAASYTPALEVSGDYYDVVRIDPDRVALVTADVSGKGVPGLVIMAMLRVVLRQLSRSGKGPAAILGEANRILRDGMRRGMFVTCLYGVLDTRTNAFRFSSAGHCPPVLFDEGGGARELPTQGKPIGLFPPQVFDPSLSEQSVTLVPGQGLLLYTDGLTEAMDAEKRQLGTQAVLASLARVRSAGAQTRVDELLRRVEAHRRDAPPTDDLTLLVVEREHVSTPQEVAR